MNEDYKTAEARFFAMQEDERQFREAAAREHAAELKSKIDKLVKVTMKAGKYSELEVRERIIAALKHLGRLPRDYAYPGEPTSNS
jgi:hypothetical protein